MVQSILDTQLKERIPRISFPWVWIGFIFGFFFIVAETLSVLLELDETFNSVLVLIYVVGWFYWLYCVHSLHRILEDLSWGRYPISTGKAVGYHIIPIFNFYWVFKWPFEFSTYLNERGRAKIANGAILGTLLFLSFLLRFFDGAISLIGMFGLVMYMSARLRQHVESLKGPDPSMLPPLPPDSDTFRREAEKREESSVQNGMNATPSD